ncbi:MAG: alpha/beta hydrolase family protein [Verrucomicrobiota bacterium]
MIAPLSKLIDWTAIQLAAARMPQADGRSPRLEEAGQFLRGPEFIPSESEPARVEFNGPMDFRFPTPRPGDFAENNVVYGRLYRCAGRWRERPAILLLHGWNDLINHQLRFPLIARRCNRAGFNAATLVGPYHFQRRPRQLGAWGNFLCPDVLRTAEAAAQAIAEIRALTGWLLREGCPAVALWGISLGAWLAGLAVCRDGRWASVVLTAPVVRMDRVIEELAFCRSIREALQGRRVEADTLNLTSARPAIPKENILLIEATHDLFAPKETIEELCQAWGRPDLWRLPHGHISFMGAPGLTGRVLRWLAPRLGAFGATERDFRQD